MEECLCVVSLVLKAEIVGMPFQISEHGTLVPGPDVHGVLKVSQVIWP